LEEYAMFFSSKSETHALTLLKQDHRLVEDLFRQWEEAEDNATAASIVSRICQALSVHAAVEETLLYPPALNALSDEDADLVREATVEHGALKGLIAVIDGSRPSEAMFDAQVTVLKEYVQHHVREEEHEFFPKLEHTDLDLEAIGLQIKALKERLEAQAANRATPTRGVVSVVDVTPGASNEGASRGRAA